MLTNTYRPHIGGVAKSVEAFAQEFRSRGHVVLIVAPEFPEQPSSESDVIRVPAIQNFNGSDFSLVLPIPGLLTQAVDNFQPDIVHAHHPYLLGMTGMRIARQHRIPIVFTHHTLYEQYTHYVPADSPALKRFVIALATQFANQSDLVFTPSESIADLLKRRGVESPMAIVPTGVNLDQFSNGDGASFRQNMRIPDTAFVVGHLGRLAEEKNLRFLAQAVGNFMRDATDAHFLLCGAGPMEAVITKMFSENGLRDRLHVTAIYDQSQLRHAYSAMDVFAFSSKSETQGMVLTEAMAAGVPVVALNASGTREVVKDRINGLLLEKEDILGFAGALHWMTLLNLRQRRAFRLHALNTATEFSMQATATTALNQFQSVLTRHRAINAEARDDDWQSLLSRLKIEWDLIDSLAQATSSAFSNEEQAMLE
jgi:glycosyltransferase involved in cell wall biosynthesis